MSKGRIGKSGRKLPSRASEEVERWCRSFEDRCRAKGIRITPQRLAVYRALAESTAHPTAEAVSARLRVRMTSLSFATVYRILEFLEAECLIRRVSTTSGVGRFEANVSPHHHFVCRRCESMNDFDGEAFSKLAFPSCTPEGFRAEELQVRVIGICAACSNQQQRVAQQAV